MAIRAYNEDYLYTAQNILGHAVDFALLSLDVSPDDFGNALAVSSAGIQFANGNPRYTAGMNGCEFAREILAETHTPYNNTEDVMYLDRSPEYWTGWALAFYQWHSDRSFMEILTIVPLSEMIRMYPVYHEMDITQFAEQMEERMRAAHPETRLRTKRKHCGMSQSELAADSGVALRQIQLFEQRQRNINNAAAITLLQLSKSLHCRMEDLMEYES